MPRGDGTGPWGMGPVHRTLRVTGRRAGYCAGYGMPGYANPAFGGMGQRRGRGDGGRGWRHMVYATGLPGWARYGYGPAWGAPPAYGPYAPMSEKQEIQMLRGQAEALKQQLDAISQRLGELEGES